MKTQFNLNQKGTICHLSIMVLSICIFLFSCQKKQDPLTDMEEQMVSFSFNPTTTTVGSGGRGSAAQEVKDATSVVITVKNANGEFIYDRYRLNLYTLNNHYVSDVIPFIPGRFYLTAFLVINRTNEIIFAAPKTGSKLEYLVKEPLPFQFDVIKENNNLVTPEVVSTDEKTPIDFGYASFSLSEVETFEFYVTAFILNNNLKKQTMTTANIKISGDENEIFNGELAKKTNLILLNEKYEKYKVQITKDGFFGYLKEFTKKEMMKFGNFPLTINLQKSDTKLTLISKVMANPSVKPNFIESMIIPSGTSNKLLLVTRNEGADCGYGTPASVWNLDLSSEKKEITFTYSLNKIQTGRGCLFENSKGELFTGSGWCGYTPPYLSLDNGKTWASADQGATHPPNSTFNFCEFNNETYVSTGYYPYYGEVYKWLGSGNWTRVLQLPQPRSLVGYLMVFNNTMFIGSSNYKDGVSVGGYPIMISNNGKDFKGTSGISSEHSITGMVVVNNRLFAISSIFTDLNYLSEWTGNSWTKPQKMNFTLAIHGNLMVSLDNNIYLYSATTEDPVTGIYKSNDFGNTWIKLLDWGGPRITTMYLHEDEIYIGTFRDDDFNAHLYKLILND